MCLPVLNLYGSPQAFRVVWTLLRSKQHLLFIHAVGTTGVPYGLPEVLKENHAVMYDTARPQRNQEGIPGGTNCALYCCAIQAHEVLAGFVHRQHKIGNAQGL